MSIDYAAIAKAGGIPKGRTVKQRRAKAKREDAKQLKAFRDAVWAREADRTDGRYEPDEDYASAHCQNCCAWVFRMKNLLSGEVHHRIYRGNKATRYDPNNGVLLCNHLVNNCHERAERKLIEV